MLGQKAKSVKWGVMNEEKMKRLTIELAGQFKKSAELEKEIKNNLDNLGYKIGGDK